MRMAAPLANLPPNSERTRQDPADADPGLALGEAAGNFPAAFADSPATDVTVHESVLLAEGKVWDELVEW